MATKRRKVRKSCKHGKLKRPVRTKKGGKRRCKKSKSKRDAPKTRERKVEREMTASRGARASPSSPHQPHQPK